MRKEVYEGRQPSHLFKVDTCHGSTICSDLDKIYHKMDPEAPELWSILLSNERSSSWLQLTMDDGEACEIIFLDGNYVAFRQNNLFLCADPNLIELRFDRTRIGPWEKFQLRPVISSTDVVQGYSFVGIRAGSQQVVHLRFDPTIENFSLSSLTLKAQEQYFRNTKKEFFEIELGEYELKQNAVLSGKQKIISTKFRGHGSIFDSTGFYHNAGFVFLRSDTKGILLATDGIYVDFAELQRSTLSGSFCSPFDGNSFNYYHWLLEGLLSLFVLRAHGICAPPIIIVSEDGLFEWQKEYLDIFGISTYLLVDGRKRDAIVVEELYWLEHRNLPDIPRHIFISMRTQILANISHPQTSFDDKIYVIRKNTARSVTNGEEVETLLKKSGFKSVALEDLSVQEQICLFASAKVVIAPHGAGLANILFCRPNTIVIELLPSHDAIRTCFWCLAEKMSLMYVFLNCRAEAGYALGMEVDVDALASLLRTVFASIDHATY